MNLELKRVPLKEIRPDPKQPRKIFDEDALHELAESIIENDVLVPILLRPSGKGYMIVYGERRFRASIIAQGKKKSIVDIPATIREMTDEQALDAQIIENLQRQNPHPMEEAVAFKSMLDQKQVTIEELAAKLGKKEFYIRQRLILNQLTEDWQKVVFKNIISISDALKVAVLPDPQQTDLYDELIDEEKTHHHGYHLSIPNYRLEQFKGSLKHASFKLEDPTLNTKMGPCTLCQFNSTVSKLFPEDSDNPRCTNVACFKNKSDVFLQREIQVALKDPTIAIISPPGGKKGQSLAKENVTVIQKDYQIIKPPEIPILQEYMESKDEDETLDDIEKSYARDLASYEKDLKEYNKKISGGKFLKAFIADGENAGKYVYIQLKKRTSASSPPEAGKELTVADIDTEIDRLKSREARQKELDAEKVHTRVKETLASHQPFIEKTSLLNTPEMIGLALMIYDHAGSKAREYLQKATKSPGFDHNHLEVYKKLAAKGKDAFPIIFRFIRMAINYELTKPTDDSPLSLGNAAAIRAIALDYFPDTVKLYEDEQGEIATKRFEKVKARVGQLNKQKRELTPVTDKKSKTKNKAATA